MNKSTNKILCYQHNAFLNANKTAFSKAFVIFTIIHETLKIQYNV